MMESDEEITPLKRRRKKNSTYGIKQQQSDEVKDTMFHSKTEDKLKEESITKTNDQKHYSDDCNPALINEIFCSRNIKPDMYFKPKNEFPTIEEKVIYCPVCKIHLGFLHGNSPQAHINDCLDREPEFEKGYCSGDSSCSLSNVDHFRQYKHDDVKSAMNNINDESADQKKLCLSDQAECVLIEEASSSSNNIQEQNFITKNFTQTSINDFFGGTKLKQRKPIIKAKITDKFLPEQKNDESNSPFKQIKKKRGNLKKDCPFYKKIPGTNFTVDAFCYGEIEECTAYFLSHFHSDHYTGLKKSFNKKLYCSAITANLVQTQIKVASEHIHVLPMDTTVEIEGVKVTLIDANHCPGAVMFLMDVISNNQRILHVGDFRAHSPMLTNPFICLKPIHTVYLDTTYCDPKYTFPPQCDVVDFVVETTRKYLEENNKTLLVCGTYSVGKEKVFKAVAENQNLEIGVTKAKYNLLTCFGDQQLTQRLTLNYNQAQLHILPMAKLNFKNLHDHFEAYKSLGYERLLAFKPSGWTFSKALSSIDDIKPITRGVVTMFGVPYSEHSSFNELKMFISGLHPKNIIPTVNNGTKESRDRMNGYFKEWLTK